MKRVGRPAVLVVLVALLWTGAAGAGDLDGDCRVGDVPAATLLVPYFEVDLGNGAGLTTLFSVANRSETFATVARVTLWTDWGVPTGAFDVLLVPRDVQTFNLRDLFNTGVAPTTSGGGLFFLPDCPEFLGGPFIDPELLRRAHTGRDLGSGLCASEPRADTDIATGYITIDNAVRCSTPATDPATPGYFTGIEKVVSDENYLWGDFFLVDPGANLAQGQTAIPVVADPDRFGPGDLTFYGRFVSYTGVDHRAPLSSDWRARFATGGVFDDTQLLVWRDTQATSSSVTSCGNRPPWYPLTERSLGAQSESGGGASFSGPPQFPLATQKVSVANDLDPPFDFGYIDVWLDFENGTPSSAWVIWLMQAQGRFSVGQNGIRVNDLCPPP